MGRLRNLVLASISLCLSVGLCAGSAFAADIAAQPDRSANQPAAQPAQPAAQPAQPAAQPARSAAGIPQPSQSAQPAQSAQLSAQAAQATRAAQSSGAAKLVAQGKAALGTTGAKAATGLRKVGSTWKYFEDGTFKKKTGLVHNPSDGTWRFVYNGVYRASSGLVQCVQPGTSKTGKWFYVRKGKLTSVTGLVKVAQGKYRGKLAYVRKGAMSSFTGLVRKAPGSSAFYYVSNGIHRSYNGALYQGGKYHYVRHGVRDVKFKGYIKIYGSTYRVRNGVCVYDRYRNLASPDHYVSYPYHCYVYRSGGTVLRYGPSTKYAAKMRVANDKALYECGYNDGGSGWIYVRDDDYNYGWAYMRHVRFLGGMAKPAIYLYPTEETNVTVSVDLRDGRLVNTEPDYGEGWSVTARPDGTIVNRADGAEYPYLFWESDAHPEFDWSRGYVVEGGRAEAFLNEVLPAMGLNARETVDFVEFWLPHLRANAYNLVTFQTERYTDAARLDIDPAPDSMLRVFMAYKAIDAPIDIEPPVVEGFERDGFTVVEWGGTEVRACPAPQTL